MTDTFIPSGWQSVQHARRADGCVVVTAGPNGACIVDGENTIKLGPNEARVLPPAGPPLVKFTRSEPVWSLLTKDTPPGFYLARRAGIAKQHRALVSQRDETSWSAAVYATIENGHITGNACTAYAGEKAWEFTPAIPVDVARDLCVNPATGVHVDDEFDAAPFDPTIADTKSPDVRAAYDQGRHRGFFAGRAAGIAHAKAHEWSKYFAEQKPRGVKMPSVAAPESEWAKFYAALDDKPVSVTASGEFSDGRGILDAATSDMFARAMKGTLVAPSMIVNAKRSNGQAPDIAWRLRRWLSRCAWFLAGAAALAVAWVVATGRVLP